jgi:hypothetical protein
MKSIRIVLGILSICLLANTVFAYNLTIRFYPVSTETKEPVLVKYFNDDSSADPSKPNHCEMIGGLTLKSASWSKIVDPDSKLLYEQAIIPNAGPIAACGVELTNALLPPQKIVCNGTTDPESDTVIKYSSGQCSVN